MPNYQNGKIYVIRSFQTEDIYIGSTTEKISVRLSKHKVKYKLWLEGKAHYYTSFEILKYDDVYIELLEKYPCDDKMELNKKEGEYIRSMSCVNKQIAGRTQKEYKKKYDEEHKEQILEYSRTPEVKQKRKEYREKNKENKKKYDKEIYEKKKEEIKKRQKEKYTCICGVVGTIGHKSRHEGTKKHLKFLDL